MYGNAQTVPRSEDQHRCRPPVSSDTAYTRTLRRAIEALGSAETLAADLGVSVVEIEGWLVGEADPPSAVFLRALDIVAHGGSGRAEG